ncbi:leucyl/phenylalanyl-tRNA--protein transferase [Methylophilus rhizosphaerae]|uniref:Leucyl/phenylalanyl-tRNA--protein transferase n=1 Tax=Methylophilus rhizosphaerae TaxID=492660 RepID=A0A1G9BTD0_9PROT|nr:leucyl/phenylalanyl-tRNA--protein transferase [Methylophilus rhizosphaerae]SDK42709.1 leucyl/phenylalanyl-tRNA--protein transferase [Methylophilus rhizosphaerae]
MQDSYYPLPGGPVLILDRQTPFPPLQQALTDPNGLIAIGGDLSAQRLLAAYERGIFPWFSPGEPILWWSPDPRMVLFPAQVHISRSLRKVMQQHLFEIRINTAFEQVIAACAATARPGQDGTWISPEMIKAYSQLHHSGYAHSVEAWQGNILVGGCYGIRIGRMFYGESMFHHVSNASKVAFAHMVQWLNTQQVGMIDCQMRTPLLESFGACEIPRDRFIAQLNDLLPHDAA